MFIPIRKGLRKRDIVLAIIIGVGTTFYAWAPILREHAAKSKQLKSLENLQQQSGKSQQKPSETQSDQKQKT